jgi:hypothetical protein
MEERLARSVQVVNLSILCLAVAATLPGELAADDGERLSKVGSMVFVAGRLTDVVTPNPQPLLELSHGYRSLQDLTPDDCPPNCFPDTDNYLISQKPFSSYEAVVDSTSGDIGPTLEVDRIVTATSTVVQSSVPIGVGFSRSLRWMNTAATEDNTQAVRVRSGQCTTNCGPDDVYFIRGYETTYSIPRFNNAGTQVTVLLLQNPTNYTINGNIYFWSINSVLVATQAFTLTAHQVQVLNTATIPTANGIGGSVTIANDGRYGDLSAKTVALEPATGFSFDSPALPRVR